MLTLFFLNHNDICIKTFKKEVTKTDFFYFYLNYWTYIE